MEGTDGYEIRPYTGPEWGKYRYEIWRLTGDGHEEFLGAYLHYRHVRQTIIGLEKTRRYWQLRAAELGRPVSIFLTPRHEDTHPDPDADELWPIPVAATPVVRPSSSQ